MQQLTRRMLSLVGLLALVGFCMSATTGEAAPASAAPTAAPLVKPFDLIVSLEWTPGTTDKLATDLVASGCGTSPGESRFVDDLIAGLRSTSAYLYDLSDGQMALRNIKIYTGGQQWANADIRVLASNSTRPAAFPGGIVDQATRYRSPSGGASVFYPGSIYLGRLWDGNGSRCGRWSMQAGSRTIGHEWAHYALYLWDEYVDQATSLEKYCTNVGPAVNGKGIITADPSKPIYSVMAYQYTSDELWHPDVPNTGSCDQTPQWTVHGASDWDTVKRFYAVSTPTTFGEVEIPFERSEAAAMFTPTLVVPSGTPADTSAAARTGAMASARMVGMSYMVRPVLDPNKQPLKDRRPLRIIGQGEIAAEGGFVLPFWGTVSTAYDRAAVIAQNWSNNARRAAYPTNYYTAAPLALTGTNNVTPAISAWQPSLTISPTLTTRTTKTNTGYERHSEVTGITVRVSDCFKSTQPRMEFFFCPAGGNCGSPVVPSLVNGARQYTFRFAFDGLLDPPASYGYVYVRVPSTGEETMSWYQLAGAVGPASIEGHAPLLDGLLNVDLPHDSKPPDGRDSMVLFSPAQTCLGTLPTGIRGILGTPLQVQVALANRAAPWGAVTSDPRLRFRLSYNQELAKRMEIDENTLVVLRYSPGSKNVPAGFRPVQVVGRSTALDWVAIGERAFSRQGEIFAIGYR